MAEFGRELEPHVTCKYGFTGDVLRALHHIGQTTEPFPVYIGTVSLFTDHPDYDVVKLDVESPWLRKLHARLSKLPNEDKWPVYKPHITVAYVKKGTCDHLVGEDLFEAEGSPSAEFTATNMTYQGATEDADDPNRDRDHILFAKPKLATVGEAQDPDDIDPNEWIAQVRLPVYWELSFAFMDGTRLWVDTAGGFSSKPQRLIRDEAERLKEQMQPTLIAPLELNPSPDQSQMYWQGVKWPEDFIYDPQLPGYRHRQVNEANDPDDIDLQAYVDAVYGQWAVVYVDPNRPDDLHFQQENGDFALTAPHNARLHPTRHQAEAALRAFIDDSGWADPGVECPEFTVREVSDLIDAERLRLRRLRAELGLPESVDPDDPERYVQSHGNRYAVYIDRDPQRIYANADGTFADAPVFMPMAKAVRLMRMATKAGNMPVRLQQEQQQPFDGLPFPADPSQLVRFRLRKNTVSKLLS